MNKKMAVMGISAAVGAAMLVTTAYAGVSTSSGYDLYKTAFNNVKQAKSLTADVHVSLTDSGTKLADVMANTKMNLQAKSMSGTTTVAVGTQQKTTSMYTQNGTRIVKSSDSDVYKVFSPSGMHSEKAEDPAKDGKLTGVENVVDALTQNIQNNITSTSGSDGSTNVDLKLSSDQLPQVVNALASLAVQNGLNHMEHHKQPQDQFAASIQSAMPKLTGDIKVANVDVAANISKDNLIQHQTAAFEITGQDAAGKAHDIVINVAADLSNYNSTTPETVDLTGKKVQKIQPKAYKELDNQQ
ncbi:hypothetical protein PP175_11720 [Aneurinibacillus sp. Ricciae_BoGa-3]|uniref:hypothetical protein n=1 Tax=Aneurinibacillus sp. Ricciae_BoGa-3 TaxID=3022697 RepID=UPI002342278B|nr:hypothetical protein [Aneurinibacillus sp. Ricciae_BoGa-3]WCK56513.1 hypothetical protein PP175_11720 [Aneurinibacillus sp. Ricciae_BoGa-3]